LAQINALSTVLTANDPLYSLNNGGKSVKEILLVGKTNFSKSLLKLITQSARFKITQTLSPKKAEEMLEEDTPDYVLCTGTIQINSEGKYFLDIS
jgi:hypothetical protein